MAQFTVKVDAYSAIEAKYRCVHKNRELRLRIIADGRAAYYRQCIVCGYAGSAVSKKIALTELAGKNAPPFDSTLEHYWYGRKNADYLSTYKKITPFLRSDAK
jgi:hypothetical protein